MKRRLLLTVVTLDLSVQHVYLPFSYRRGSSTLTRKTRFLLPDSPAAAPLIQSKEANLPNCLFQMLTTYAFRLCL